MPLLDEIGPLERVFSRPSWADPSFMLLANEIITQEYTFTTTDVVIVVPPDPKRWAVGFSTLVTAPDQVLISPINDINISRHVVTIDWVDNWWTIFNYGPMVPAAWYGQSIIGARLMVYTTRISV